MRTCHCIFSFPRQSWIRHYGRRPRQIGKHVVKKGSPEQLELQKKAVEKYLKDTGVEHEKQKLARHLAARNRKLKKKQREKAKRAARPESITEEDQELRKALQSKMLSESPNVKFDDIAGLEAAKADLQQTVVIPIKFPELYGPGKAKPKRGVLLYGPPGTGKSYLAKAVATEAKSTLFNISSSDIKNKWMGNSEKLVKILFELVRENRPSITFVDEIDAILGSRESDGGHMLGLKTEFMVQLDGLGSDNEGILFLAAANLPWVLDSAIRRRFQSRIYIPLPDAKARAQMFKIYTRMDLPGLTEDHYRIFAEMSEGFSGSDISNVVDEVLAQPAKKVAMFKFWKKVEINGVTKWTPCKEDCAGAEPMNWTEIEREEFHPPKVEFVDFFNVLSKVKPTVSQNDTYSHVAWTEEFGQEGA